MKNLTRQRFEEFANVGTVRKPTGHAATGEDVCETALEFGLANGYSLADICHFYAHWQRNTNSFRDNPLSAAQVVDAAYTRFVHDAVAFAGTLLDAAGGL